MRQELTFIRENITLFSIAGYGIGLIYMSIFYYCFNIPIVNYLTLNDILLNSVTLIVPVAITLVVLEYIYFGISSIFFVRKLSSKEKEILSFVAMLAIYFVIFITYLKNGLNANPNMQFYTFFTSFVLIARIGNRNRNTIKFALPVCLLGLGLGLSHLIECTKIGLGDKDVKFNYCGEIIITGFKHNLNYIGETSSTIFLYNFKKKVSYVYEKSNISKLKYINKIEKELVSNSDIQFYAFNTARYKITTDTISKPFEWLTHDYRNFYWIAEKNPIGLSRLMYELDHILDDNNLDFEEASYSHSSLPTKININNDFKESNDAFNSGNSELHKKWVKQSGEVDLQLSKDRYIIKVSNENKNE